MKVSNAMWRKSQRISRKGSKRYARWFGGILRSITQAKRRKYGNNFYDGEVRGGLSSIG